MVNNKAILDDSISGGTERKLDFKERSGNGLLKEIAIIIYKNQLMY